MYTQIHRNVKTRWVFADTKTSQPSKQPRKCMKLLPYTTSKWTTKIKKRLNTKQTIITENRILNRNVINSLSLLSLMLNSALS